MRKLDNTEVKKYILNILCEFAAFCDQNGLRYYLSGGTLLGAVRHKGFALEYRHGIKLKFKRQKKTVIPMGTN